MIIDLNFDNDEIYFLLVDVCQEYGVDPSSSLEVEDFFRQLLTKYMGTLDLKELTLWLHEKISQHFLAIDVRPKWIQGAQWPIVDGTPMVFVAQINLSVQSQEIASEFFHDDTSLYVFIGKKIPPKVIVQQY